jgi:uncharacterized MAPEG superfamily protein
LCGDVLAEDAWIVDVFQKIFGKNADKETYSSLKTRFARVVGNDLENIPVGLAMLWLAGLASSSSTSSTDNVPSPAAQSVIRLTQVFTVSRLAHSALFYGGVTGVRTVAYLGGFVSSFGAGIVALKGLSGL